MRICVINHATVKVVVEPREQLCVLLEVWVLGVGMSTLARKRLCTPRIGDSQVLMTLEHDKTNVSLGRMAY
jgi:hypothetical protein